MVVRRAHSAIKGNSLSASMVWKEKGPERRDASLLSPDNTKIEGPAHWYVYTTTREGWPTSSAYLSLRYKKIDPFWFALCSSTAYLNGIASSPRLLRCIHARAVLVWHVRIELGPPSGTRSTIFSRTQNLSDSMRFCGVLKRRRILK